MTPINLTQVSTDSTQQLGQCLQEDGSLALRADKAPTIDFENKLHQIVQAVLIQYQH